MTKFKSGDLAYISKTMTPCRVDRIYSALFVGVWIGWNDRTAFREPYRIVNPIELEYPPAEALRLYRADEQARMLTDPPYPERPTALQLFRSWWKA